MKEIEILVKVYGNPRDVEKKLNKVAKFVGNIPVKDRYYYDPLRRKLYFGKSRQSSFRLRKKGNNVYITHKHDNYDKWGKWLYSDELETEIKDFVIAKRLIEALGMKQFVGLDIIKKTFKNRNYEIVLESVRGLGTFLEVEALPTDKKESVNAIRDHIWKFIKDLQIKTSKELNMGKSELMHEKRKK